MNWYLILTSLNHLSIFLLVIFSLLGVTLLIYFVIYTLFFEEPPEIFDRFARKFFTGLLRLIIIFFDTDERTSIYTSEMYRKEPWFGSFDYWYHEQQQELKLGSSPPAYKDPDVDSLLSVTTISDVYKDRRLSVDLSEKCYLKF